MRPSSERLATLAIVIVSILPSGASNLEAQAPPSAEQTKKRDEAPFKIEETVEVTATRSALDAEKTPVSTTVVPGRTSRAGTFDTSTRR